MVTSATVVDVCRNGATL